MATPNLAAADQAEISAAPIKKVSWQTDTVILYGSFALLLFGPLAFGAVENWAIFFLQAGASVILLVWAIHMARSGQGALAWSPLFAPMLAFAGLIAVQLVLGTSAYAHDTVRQAMLYALYGVLAFLVVQTLKGTAQIRTLACVLTAYGGSVALFALVQSLSANDKLYWIRTPRSGGWIYGPYVNHNHYAGLMEMLFPIALVMTLTRHVRGRWRALVAASAVLMASTVVLSGSRGGMVALVVELAIVAGFMRTHKIRRTALTAGVVLTVVACLVFWIGGDSVISRLASIHSEARTELDGGLRLTIDRDGLRMFTKAPLVGWGIGTFPTVYPQFRTFFTDKFINEAHNDYLQLLVEGGSVGFALMIWFLVLVFRNGIRKIDDWTLKYDGAVSLAAILGCSGILVHSFVDFNLQIPANAALFYTLCAIAATSTNFTSPQRVRRRHRTNPPAFDVGVSAEGKSTA